ncbi:MAG: hypothetical protein IBJ10_07305 [Phycisphaerales bacterium]|nr:hypothetical protein [Phycisphaerales bacterium]
MNAAGDQEKSPLPVIRDFAAQPWSEMDLVNYRSATAPGYHLFMAGIVKVFGDGVTLLQLVNAGISLLLLLNVARGAARLISPTFAAFAAAPLLCSSYFLGSSIWLTTDNAALLFVTLALGSAALAPANPVRSLRQGGFAAMAVGTRQLHVWLAAPILIAAAHRSGLLERWTPKVPVAEHPPRPGGLPALAAGAIGASMPLLLLAYFVWIWGGLIPPTFRDLHGGGDVESVAGAANFALPALAMSLLGALGVFYLPVARKQVRSLRPTDPLVVACVLVGLIAALAPETSFNPQAGRRYGWMWEIIKRAPAPMERSVVPVVLAPMGALMALLLWRTAKAAGRARQASILVFGLVCWMAAQTANAQAWQRYCEPLILIFLAWMACLAARPWRRRRTDSVDDPALIGALEPPATWENRDRLWPWIERAGPAALAGLQLLLAMYTLYWPIFSRRG